MQILFYDCVSAAGFGVPSLMEGLYAGKDHSTNIKNSELNTIFQSGSKICFIPDDAISDFPKKRFIDKKNEPFKNSLIFLLNNLCSQFLNTHSFLIHNKKILILLSSTKGSVEDYIWNNQNHSEYPDPFHTILNSLAEEIKTMCADVSTLVVSNACASSHVAFQIAEDVLSSESFDFVFLFTADLIGPFIYNGFHSLKILTQSTNKPFDQNRDGLQLGEACSFFVLSNKLKDIRIEHPIEVTSVATEIEGASMTKPSHQGESLFRCLLQISKSNFFHPDFIMAHGTGTLQNDFAEEAALSKFCKNQNLNIPVLGTKWSIGHTLGSSGAMDVIASCEVLKRKKFFCLSNTQTPDLCFESQFLINSTLNIESNQITNQFNSQFNSALVTSLGFGGIHAALYLRKC